METTQKLHRHAVAQAEPIDIRQRKMHKQRSMLRL